MAPSFNLKEETRQALFADAVKLCRHVGYRNAGTVEFMVDKSGAHYFLEVNPRVQVGPTPHHVGTMQPCGSCWCCVVVVAATNAPS